MRLFGIRDLRYGGYYGGTYFLTPQAAENFLWSDVCHHSLDIFYYHNYYDRRQKHIRYQVFELDWIEREGVLSEEYKAPIWSRARFWDENYDIHGEHFAHVSLDDPTQIAFIESAAKGERGIYTRMKPGRYLKRFFGDVLTEMQIAHYAEWWAKGEKPPSEDMEGSELLFATTPQEIVEVYATGPDSCMQGIDGVRVYASGDLAIAYIKDKNGRVRSRALCWPDKKAFGRVYPTPDNYADDGYDSEEESEEVQKYLYNRLKELDYTHISEDNSVLDGARVVMEYDEDENQYVMPYLDNGLKVTPHKDGYFVLSKKGVFCSDNTSGYMDAEYEDVQEYMDGKIRIRCDCCHERFLEGEVKMVEAYRSQDSHGRPRHEPHDYCPSCAKTYVYTCGGTGILYYTYVDKQRMGDRTEWSYYAARNTDLAFLCCMSSSYWPNSEKVEMYNGQLWSREAFKRYGFEANGKFYPLNMKGKIMKDLGFAA